MSETEMWRRLAEHLPPGRLEVWADTIVLHGLGGRTVNEAIRDGLDFKRIWRAAAEMLEIPASAV